MYLEDAGQPEWIDWIAEATDVTGLSWRALKFAAERAYRKLTGNADTHLGTELHRLIGDAHRSSSSMPLLAMGLDTPDGKMTLNKRDDRMLEVDWDDDHSEQHYERARRAARALAEAIGGKYAEVPFARRFNREMTVHPLGGCPMGRTRQTGLVSSESGMVFDVPGLYVADGSVMPGPVGTNPSLTIAAVADRFAGAFLQDA